MGLKDTLYTSVLIPTHLFHTVPLVCVFIVSFFFLMIHPNFTSNLTVY